MAKMADATDGDWAHHQEMVMSFDIQIEEIDREIRDLQQQRQIIQAERQVSSMTVSMFHRVNTLQEEIISFHQRFQIQTQATQAIHMPSTTLPQPQQPAPEQAMQTMDDGLLPHAAQDPWAMERSTDMNFPWPMRPGQMQSVQAMSIPQAMQAMQTALATPALQNTQAPDSVMHIFIMNTQQAMAPDQAGHAPDKDEPYGLPASNNASDFVNNGSKPPHTYAEIISMAIESAPSRRLTSAQICDWISDNFPFYKTVQSNWRTSVINRLSTNKKFIKRERCKNVQGNIWYWTIAEPQTSPGSTPEQSESHVQQRQQPAPEQVMGNDQIRSASISGEQTTEE